MGSTGDMEVDVDIKDKPFPTSVGHPHSFLTGFSSTVQSALKSSHGENFVYSPLGLSLVMGMSKVGSQGNTAKEIGQALGFPLEDKKLAQAFGNALESIKKAESAGFSLEISTRAFIDKGYNVNPTYMETLVRQFDSGLEEMDLNRDEMITKNVQDINAWVKSSSKDKITNIICEDDFRTPNPNCLVLCNVVYFNGKWLKPFKTLNTRKCEFHVFGREAWDPIQVDMMHNGFTGRIEPFEYCLMEQLDAKLLKLPYVGNRFSMIFYVPNLYNGLPKIEKNIAGISIGTILHKLREYKKDIVDGRVLMDIAVPKFKIQTNMNLVDPLKKLGIQDAFKVLKANFAGITDNPEGLFISNVAQKAIIEVDELGTVAAAATSLSLCGGGCPEFIRVKVDRSFYFQIVDEEQELVIFSGVVLDPTN